MKKKILIIGGHDPSGGAGVMMDAKIWRLNACHPLTLITSETVQNSLFKSIKYDKNIEFLNDEKFAILNNNYKELGDYIDCLLYTSDAADEP